MSTEEWRPIPSCPGYEASNLGRVRSVAFGTPRVLRPTPMKRGNYPAFSARNGTRRTIKVHVAVLEAFRGPKGPGQVCRHLNDNPADNRIDNLAWGSPSENGLDVVRLGAHHLATKTHCHRGHAFDAENTYVTPRGHRMCKRCRAISKTAYLARRRAA